MYESEYVFELVHTLAARVDDDVKELTLHLLTLIHYVMKNEDPAVSRSVVSCFIPSFAPSFLLLSLVMLLPHRSCFTRPIRPKAEHGRRERK